MTSNAVEPRAPVTLATDLDGTLLAGTPQARARILELFAETGPDRRLIFVTGRGLESVLPVLADPLVPRPDWIIADVGATVVRGSDLHPVLPLQAHLSEKWPGTLRVLDALAGFPQLHRQEVPQERRCSFLCDESQQTPELRAAVEALGCQLLFSAGQYLDVLPKGISKGSTLLALARQEGLPLENILVAGDTLNDLSLFETRLKGVVVGSAEEELVRKVSAWPQTFVAQRPGCGGILDGLRHHGFLNDGQLRTPTPERGTSELLMVYHRLPFDEAQVDGRTQWRRPKSPNGIIPTLLGFFADGAHGSWVAWSKQDSRTPENFEPHAVVDAEKYPNLKAARIALTEHDVDLFYKRFSKEAFWPIIFSFPDKAEFDDAHWEHYLEINRVFAERTAQEAAEGALVWIHDYNLWMVPAYLRAMRPDLRIAFFHHTAFPSPDVFNIIPWRREIIGSLLQCDYVGFHVPRYVENFAGAVRSHAPVQVLETQPCAPRWLTFGCALGVDTMTTRLKASGRTVRLGAHPVGIDVDAIGKLLESDEVKAKIATIENELDGRTGILSIERLDYVKGSMQKLAAFERLLENHPKLRGRVVLLNIVTPAAPGMEVYEALRTEVDEAVGHINGRFATLDWTPIRYFFRSLPYEDVVAHYAASDVAWIAPLRDGLNLVAKEYVATVAAHSGRGTLLLSEFAGAAVELHGALLTNAYDVADMERALFHAVTLPEQEREQRMRRLAGIVRNGNVRAWGEEFLAAVAASGPGSDEDNAYPDVGSPPSGEAARSASL